MGMMTLGVFALTPVGLPGSVLQQFSHAIAIAGLLLVMGLMFERRRTVEISEYGGLAAVTPVLSAVLLVMILSFIGLPALSGFIGQMLILRACTSCTRAGPRLRRAEWCWVPHVCCGCSSERCSVLPTIRRIRRCAI